MRQILATVGPVLVVLLVVWIAVRRARRRRDDRQPPVTPRWLREHIYNRTGDEP